VKMLNQNEIVQFSFVFDSEWSSTAPVIEIRNNNQQVVAPMSVTGKQTVQCLIEMLPGQKNNVLEIVRSNHDEQTQQLCQLVELKADDNNLNLILNHAEFYPQYPKIWYQEQVLLRKEWPLFHKGWSSWGWNGSWQMKYDTPFYDWLLEKL
jgi:hypothetical protein